MKTKSSVLMFSTLLAAFALLAAPVSAESTGTSEKPAKSVDAPAKPGKPGKSDKPGKDSPKRPGVDRVEKMREQLELTDAQVEQLRPIFAAEREEMMAKRKELGKEATREQQREAADAVHTKYKPKIDAVLTAEQKEKVGKHRERAGKRAGGPSDAAAAKGADKE